jgi:hypothetical protein
MGTHPSFTATTLLVAIAVGADARSIAGPSNRPCYSLVIRQINLQLERSASEPDALSDRRPEPT